MARTILASGPEIALAELLDGEKESVDSRCETTFDEDPDDRPVLFQLAERYVAVLDVTTGELLGTMIWRAIPYGSTMAGTAWNVGIKLLPTARGRGLGAVAGQLLARHLFATTDIHRIEANTDVANAPGQRGLERAGFRREGITRGVQLRRGKRRDMVLYSLLRSDLESPGASRTVLGRRDRVVLAQAWPEDHAKVLAASGKTFSPDPARRPSPATSPAVSYGAMLDADSGGLLGTVRWHAVDYGDTIGCAAWNIGITLVPGADVAATALRLLADYLFGTTELDRVEAGTDVDDLATQQALEEAGFRRDGVIRGTRLRAGKRRDLALYGILRIDLHSAGSLTGRSSPGGITAEP